MIRTRRIAPVWTIFGGALVAFACSLTLPPEEDFFGKAGQGGGGRGGGAGNASGGVGGKEGADAGGGGARAGQSQSGGAPSAASAGESGEGGVANDTFLGGSGGSAGELEGSAGSSGAASVPVDGTVVIDDVGSVNGKIYGGASWISSGKIGGALQLSGSQSYVDIPVTTLATLDEVTISIWFMRQSSVIWTRVIDIGSSQYHWMYFSPAATPPNSSTGMHAALDYSNQITAELHVTNLSPAIPPLSVWTHVTLVWSRATFGFFVNGELAAAKNDVTHFSPKEFVAGPPIGESVRIWLGRSSFEADQYFTGALDDLRFYDHILSPEHVKALYLLDGKAEANPSASAMGEGGGGGAAPVAPFDPDAGLVARYRFDEGLAD